MSDEQNLTKRERQKLRRQQKLEAQRAEQRKARTKRTVATVAVVAIVLGAIGAFAFTRIQESRERRESQELALQRLEELGCTEVEETPILPSQHLSGTELVSNPPDVLYPDRPATSGRHLGQVAQTGVYDKVVDERLLVHNLEHGYVNVFYDQDAPEDQVEELKDFARAEIDRGREKIIVSAWKAEFAEDGNFAWAAWGARQICSEFDEGVLSAFIDDWIHLNGNAPERSVPAHRGGTTGGLDPDEEEGDLLLPPLGDPGEFEADDIMEDPVEDGEIDPEETTPPDEGDDADEGDE